ncbi:hypothetical protein F5Y19DRAFT_368797 [Xylariaceae sp. FL1651]|nr:hypothetical protein F5Y19DRAFT_368797 [Xylariaceae sp. FL1651]
MEASTKILSKGVMMGAAISFSAIGDESILYRRVALGLFGSATAVHIALSMNAAALFLYLLSAVLILTVLAVVVLSQPHFSLVPVLEYAPVLITYVLFLLDECSRLHKGALEIPLGRTGNFLGEFYTSRTPRTMTQRSFLSFGHSNFANRQTDDHHSVISAPSSPPFGFLWSRGPSRIPSPRSSDISLSSSKPESFPSSWGTMTKAWFPDFPAQRRHEFDEPSRIETQRTRSI